MCLSLKIYEAFFILFLFLFFSFIFGQKRWNRPSGWDQLHQAWRLQDRIQQELVTKASFICIDFKQWTLKRKENDPPQHVHTHTPLIPRPPKKTSFQVYCAVVPACCDWLIASWCIACVTWAWLQLTLQDNNTSDIKWTQHNLKNFFRHMCCVSDSTEMNWQPYWIHRSLDGRGRRWSPQSSAKWMGITALYHSPASLSLCLCFGSCFKLNTDRSSSLKHKKII